MPSVIRPGQLAAVVVASAIVGAATRLGELVLPRQLESAANSSAPWVLATFAIVYLAQATGRWAAVLGAVSFVVMDVAFYIAFTLSGAYYPHSYLAFWLIVAAIIGPLVGLMAAWLRRGTWRRAVAIAGVPAVFLGEAAFVAFRFPDDGLDFPLVLAIVGVALLAALIARFRPTGRWLLLALALAIAGAALFLVVYGIVPLVIGKVVP